MKKASQIADEIVTALDLISDLNWQLYEAYKRFRALQREFKHCVKFNRTIKLH